MNQSTAKKKNWGPPIREVNTNFYHPMLHTPPGDLYGVVTLETIGPKPTNKIIVTQQPTNRVFKPGPDINEDMSYGQFVEMGGRKRHRRRTQKKRRTQKTKKRRKRKKKRNLTTNI